MSQCKIFLENYSGLYYAGSEIRGRLECYFDDNTHIRGIKLRIKGTEFNQWTGTETYTGSDNKTHTRTITLTGDNDVLYVQQILFGSEHGSQHLGRGRHVYPFSYSLPHDIPSSFEGPHGHIMYKIKGIVDRPMAFDYEDQFIFIVQSPIDFTRLSRDLQNPSTYSDEKTVCCWCCAGGNISMDVELPKTAFVAGENIPLKVFISNLSNSNVESVNVKLLKDVTYRVTRPHHESRSDSDLIQTLREHGVGAHGEHTFNLNLHIPPNLQIPNFTKCELFGVSYNLQVSCEMPSCTLDLDISIWDIQFGHVQCAPIDEPEPEIPKFDDNFAFPSNPGFVPSPGEPGFYPPPLPGGYQPENPYPPNTAYPPGPGGAFVPPPAYSDEKRSYPPGAPTAPSSSGASAPPTENNPKAAEAAGFPSAPTSTSSEPPPPSYDQISPNPPYPK